MIVNTEIEYLYRDASNYKKWNTAVLIGELSEADQQTILDCLQDTHQGVPF